MKKILQVLLKLAIAAALLALVLSKAQSDKIWAQMHSLSVPALAASLALMMAAHLLTAERMRFFLSTISVALERGYALQLYFVGALCNLLLPTGVGGDAVKAWALKKRYALRLTPIVKVLILDRVSGLYILCLIILAGMVRFAPNNLIAALGWAGFPITTIVYLYLAKKLFGQRPRDGLHAFWYSFMSQGLWCIVIYVLYCAMGNGGSAFAYLVLYAMASIVAMLPVSIGGLGLREMTFFYGSAWLSQHAGVAVDGERAVAISLAYFAICMVSSLPGLLWIGSIWPMMKKHEQ